MDRRAFVVKSSVLAISPLMIPDFFSKKIKFGLVSDSHYADRDANGKRHYRGALEKMQECIEVMNAQKVDFIIHLGDFKDEDKNPNEENTLKYLKEIEAEFAKFNGPRFHCIGNHDVDSITKQQFLENVENTGISKEKSFYSFDKNGFHFIVLDPNFHEDGRDHFYKEGANWQESFIPENQIKWLKEDLKTTTKPTVIFCHQLLFDYNHAKWTYHVGNSEEIRNTLASSQKVVAVFQGHVHEESQKEIEGIHYITELAMVDYSGLDNNSFSIIELSKKHLKKMGYKRASNQIYY